MLEILVLIWFSSAFIIKNVVYSICFHIPASQGINKDDKFAAWACWIQGMYVYKELKSRVDEVAYFGIPKHIQLDGMMPDGNLCSTTKQFEREPDPDCKPMQKTFCLQV